MKKKILIYVVLLGILTACSNVDDNYSSNNSSTEELEIKQAENKNDDNAQVQVEIDNEKSDFNGNDNNSKVKDVTSLIPSGWHILEDRFEGKPVKAKGDLNKDGVEDVAIVIEKTQETEGEKAQESEFFGAPRSLLIAFGNEDNTFSLSIIADDVVLPEEAGGVWGDPFDSLTIDRGSVVLSDYGGSNWRWYNKYRFRFQDNDWFLIGATMGWYFTGTSTSENGDEDDYNLLTGDYILRRTDENGKVKYIKGNRGKKKLVKLSEFNINDM